uniref:Uncharacterized protein n=1 Tax=Oryza sativa subsp. japonica TaxID=39947 RepID=Q654D1_ORYSJ|nr:hypothetical protein [Oryza sativa Japonica Group]
MPTTDAGAGGGGLLPSAPTEPWTTTTDVDEDGRCRAREAARTPARQRRASRLRARPHAIAASKLRRRHRGVTPSGSRAAP